jgi:molybdenum cofactor cytidylyltransferase
MNTNKKVAGVILAAGDSSRFGQNKLLLDWNGIPLVRYIAEQAIQSKLAVTYLVAGFESKLVLQAVEGLPLHALVNPSWKEGQSTTITTAIDSLMNDIDGVCFLLSDQPFISTQLINALIRSFQVSNADIIAPFIGNRRANPIIFSRTTFPALKKLKGDEGGRQIINQFRLHGFKWNDERILEDIDTEMDYQTLINAKKP